MDLRVILSTRLRKISRKATTDQISTDYFSPLTLSFLILRLSASKIKVISFIFQAGYEYYLHIHPDKADYTRI